MNLRHQICACLYQGKACEVFLVRDIVTSQLYALKRIVRHHAKFSDAYLRAVYQREACMLGWLQQRAKASAVVPAAGRASPVSP